MIEAVMYSVISPWGLAVLSTIWAYPAVLEEVVKWGILQWSVGRGAWSGRMGWIVGLAFGVGELGLYSMNAWSSGEWESILIRLILTVPMHGLTGGIIGAGMKRGMVLLTLIVAMALHGVFNNIISSR